MKVPQLGRNLRSWTCDLIRFARHLVYGPCPGMSSISNDAPDGLFDTIEDAIEAYSLSLIGSAAAYRL